MIKINNKQYQCNELMYHKVANTEHLHIKIEGQLECSGNRLDIEYKGIKTRGIKILPREYQHTTEFLVYILQDGDSEG